MSKKRQEKYAGGMIFSFLMRRRVLHAKRAVAKQCGLRSNTRRSPHLHHVGTDFIPFRFFFFRKNRHTCRRSSFFVRLTLWRRTRRPLGAKGSPVLFIMKKRIELKVSKNSWQNSCFWFWISGKNPRQRLSFASDFLILFKIFVYHSCHFVGFNDNVGIA